MGDVVTPAIKSVSGGDGHVALAMELGALMEGGLGPTYGVGDNGHSFGPFQINLPYHPGVTATQAIDPQFAVSYMLGAYQAAVAQIPESLWQSNPEQAAEQAAVIAERPATDYFSSHGRANVDAAYATAVSSLEGSGISIPDILKNPGAVPPGFGSQVVPGLPNNPFDLVGNMLGDFLKALISSGLVLRGTLMVAGLIILFIGLSQISKGDQTAAQTVGGGTERVTVRAVQAGTGVRKAQAAAAA